MTVQCDSELYQLTVIAAGRKRLRHEKEESEAANTKVCMNLGHKMDVYWLGSRVT